MNRILVAAVLLAFMPTANAADAKKADFSTNAEFRVRYMMVQNPGADENSMPATTNDFTQRLKMGVNYRASEKVSATATLMHNMFWGTEADSTPDTVREENMLMVNEAFVNWMAADDLHLRIGRQNFGFGDGNVMGVNDWEPTPFAFDGISANYDMEMGSFKIFTFKVDETDSIGGAAGNPPDGEHDLYGLSFDLKSMPEILKMVNVHVIKENKMAVLDAAGTTAGGADDAGRDFLRYGFVVGGETAGFDFKATWEKVTGDYSASNAWVVSKVDGDSDMMQVNLGYGMESMMKSHLGFVWHKDSGDDGTSATDESTYQGFFYEQHENAGLMDLVGYGNLTFMGVTADFMPMDSTKVGLGYYMFSKTEEKGAVNPGMDGGRLFGGTNTTDTTKDDIGSEIDLYAEHMYDSNLSTMIRLGYFTPGDTLKSADAANGGPDKGDKVMQIFLQAKMTF